MSGHENNYTHQDKTDECFEEAQHVRAIRGLVNRVSGQAELWQNSTSEERKFRTLSGLLDAIDGMHAHAVQLREFALETQRARMQDELAASEGLRGEALVRLVLPRMGEDGEVSDEYAIDARGLLPTEKYTSAATPRTVMARRTGLTVVKSAVLLDRVLGEGEYLQHSNKIAVINLLARPADHTAELQPGYTWHPGLEDTINDLTIGVKKP